MHIPFWVAAAQVVSGQLLAVKNHLRALQIEEGRTRPAYAMARHARHFSPWTRPETAKPASSQGEALARKKSEFCLLKTSLHDMNMEFAHD